MGNIVCCFGHREVFQDVLDILRSTIENLILDKNVKTFLTGGMGDFDDQFTCTIHNLKNKYPDISIFLVKPYLSCELNTNKDYYDLMYDKIIIPDVLFGVHPKSAITKRNRWLVENSNIIVSYIHRNFGGAYEAVKYAKRLNKQVINIYQQKCQTSNNFT